MNSEFIVKVRYCVRNIKRIEDNDILELESKMDKLIKGIEHTIVNHPEIGLRQLKSNFNEIMLQFRFTEEIVLRRLHELSQEGKDEYFNDYANTKEVGLKNEEALSYLLELLLTYFPEFAKNHKSQYERFLPNKVPFLKEEKESLRPQRSAEGSVSNQQKRKEFIAKEVALAYILDLYAKGGQVPTNRVEGGYDAKEIKRIGKEKGFRKPDTFYRAVRTVLGFDLNSTKQLELISKDWLNAVETLSINWIKTKEYLVTKNLIKD